MRKLLFLALGLLTAAPSFPSSDAYGSSRHYISVQWNKGSYGTTVVFWLFRSDDLTHYAQIATTRNNTQTTWTDSTVQGGKTYSYYVAAYDTLTKEESGPSDIVTQAVPK
jgi:hypothetical protein